MFLSSITKNKMKDKTKVKAKNVWMVAEIKAENPHATYREIQEKTWLSHATISKAKTELKQSWRKDATIQYIIKSSKERIKRIQDVLDRFVDESLEKEKLSRSDTALIKDIAKDDLQRVTVFGGDVTDEEWGFVLLDSEQQKALDTLLSLE